MVGSIDGGPGTLLLRSPAAAQYAAGHLLFVREGTLMAQPFDPSRLRLSGEAVPVAEGVNLIANATALAVFSASDDGVLLYQAGGAFATRKLVWRDRDGRVTGSLGDDAVHDDVALSPQGDQAAVTVAQSSGAGDVWVYDIARAVRTRLAFDTHDEWRVVWSPDGKTLAFASDREGHYDLYTVAVGGTIRAVPVEPRGEALSASMPKPMFFLQTPETNNSRYTLGADGSRFLSIESVAAQVRPPLTVVVSWTARVTK